jgi:hypothetical protein
MKKLGSQSEDVIQARCERLGKLCQKLQSRIRSDISLVVGGAAGTYASLYSATKNEDLIFVAAGLEFMSLTVCKATEALQLHRKKVDHTHKIRRYYQEFPTLGIAAILEEYRIPLKTMNQNHEGLPTISKNQADHSSLFPDTKL